MLIICTDDMLIIGQTRKEVESTRDTLIYLLQHLGFLLNLKKSVLQPCQIIEFLGIIVNSVNLTLSHLLQKVEKVHKECTKMYNKNWTLILELTFRPLVVNYPSSFTRSLTNSKSSKVTDTFSEIEEVISNEYKIDSLSERGTAMVDVELTAFKCEALYPESSRPGVDLDRCLKKQVDGSMQRSLN